MYSREKRSKDEWKNVGKMKVMCVCGGAKGHKNVMKVRTDRRKQWRTEGKAEG